MDIEYLKYLADIGAYPELNNQVMVNTLELCNSDPDLMESINKSIEKEFIIFEEDKYCSELKSGETKIIISNKRAYEAAKCYTGKKVAVLDFANNHSVGGAPFSAGAQEESMCRCSTLYSCLNTEYNLEHFYKKHRDEYDSGIIDHYGNDDMIYVPGVTVFKTDGSIPELMDKSEWYNVDVIVSAAPELWHGNQYTLEKLGKVLRGRIKRMLDIANNQNVEVLILGAFGCGAFLNPPELVARLYKEELSNYSFEVVEFAIHSRGDMLNENYETFNEVFNGVPSKIDLSRFYEAQDRVYDCVVDELQNGRKEGHRMWYIFPQIKGLGHSDMSKKYSFKNFKEAQAYYNDLKLRDRLLYLCNILLSLETNDPHEIFGGIDSLKLKSCITLFLQVDPDNEVLLNVLNKFYDGELDKYTIKILERDGYII